MANFLKFNGEAIRLPTVSADPSSPPNGAAWYNSTSGEVKFRQNGTTIVLGQVSSEFSDALFRITDDVDGTKKVAIEASNVATGTTRTITMPDTDVDLADIAANTAALAGKEDALPAGTTADYLRGDKTFQTLDKAAVGLANVDNTSDADKPISTATASALAGKEPTISAATTGDYYRGDKTFQPLDKAAVGLGNVDNTSDADKPISTATQAALDLKADDADLANYVPTSEKGANNGVATLDAGGKIPAAQLPSSVMEYKGSWNASTNSPSLADGVGDAGDLYRVSVAGTQDLGSGSTDFEVGDLVIYNGSIWERSPNGDAVVSVNGLTGEVVLTTSEISEGSNLYFTNARTLASTLTGFSAGSDTAVLPADTVLQAIEKLQGQVSARLSSVSEDTSPALGGDLSTSGNAVLHGTDGLEKGQSAGSTFFDDYDHSLALAATSSGVISALTVDKSVYDSMKIDYKIAAGSNSRVGTLLVAVNGSNIAITDTYAETGDTDITFSAALNVNDLEISFNNPSASAGTMRAQSRRFKA